MDRNCAEVRHDTQYNDTQHNETQHKALYCDNQQMQGGSITVLSGLD